MSEINDLTFEGQTIIDVDLEKEMRKSYIDYAMSVIVSRALPDVRDGLKPVHRRILYAMYEDNLTADKPYRKSATTVGNVLGRYHPHGDASVYDALVRLAQDFSLRYPLVDGHGNFGSVDGDPPAAYRYTEARMAKLAANMLSDIEKDTVDFVPNYDDKMKEPFVLPSRFPNLLVNGSSGIAVGMATNIPPHNLREVCQAICYVIDNPEATLEDICRFIKGPDFPTGGIIMGRAGIRAAYATGRGRIIVRCRAEIEEHGQGRFRIVITELPYMVNKARLIENIADLHKERRVEGITDLRDESDRDGMRIVIELRRDANPQVVLNQLYQYTQMQETFSVINLALIHNQSQPRVLTLREMLDEYIRFQYEVVERRTRYDLRRAQERAHILEGLKIACENIDEVIRIIRQSYDDAKVRLMERFDLSDVQAQAILDMRLGRLQGLEVEKIENELEALHKKIAEYEDILAHAEKIYAIVKQELTEICEKFGDERRTEISMVENELDIEDLIEEEQCAYTLTRLGYIKRLPVSAYRTQKRGGRGITAMATREEDIVETVFTASTHDHVLFFTNLGKVLRLKGYMIPEASRTSKGTNIVNLLQLEGGERVTAMIPIKEFCDEAYVFFATKQGVVKRTHLSDLHTARKAGVRVITLNEGDELIGVRLTDGQDKVILCTHDGRGIRFDEKEVRTMGRSAAGVRGIRLSEGDYVVGVACDSEGQYLLTVTENGYGKLTSPREFTEHHRGGGGIIAHNLTDKTGPLAGIKSVDTYNDILLITDEGVIIRTGVETIRVCSRSSQGVKLMRLDEGVKLISLAKADKEEDAGESLENTENGENAQQSQPEPEKGE
ncbi:DNA gyrase subunit A [Intestinimonas butyriciproducens]|uniref:DNA gyrase subunit A n=1 Tax=Intestinimonas butyriciproducens TaxID=1297617 RepID=UPI00195E7B42|nr:DNA gyrase subunit A [Intestinimonas butyriciproducens]MBM6917283.1 DNA gyrase subunit A [Intestinimonas butyriciproducens]